MEALPRRTEALVQRDTRLQVRAGAILLFDRVRFIHWVVRLNNLPRVGDIPGDGARGDDGRAGQINLSIARSHPAAEVAVGRTNGCLAGPRHAHVVAHARPTARRARYP